MKDGFLLYTSHYDTIKRLTTQEKADLLDAIFQYHIDQEQPQFESHVLEIAFSFLKQQFDRDEDKYRSIVERNRINGAKPKKASGLFGNPDEPKKADNDNVNDNVNDNDNNPLTPLAGGECDLKIDFKILGETFNEKLPELKVDLPLTQEKENAVMSICRDYGKVEIMKMIQIAQISPHLLGQTNGWRANFDWLFVPKNFKKVLEGRYLNTKANNKRIAEESATKAAKDRLNKQKEYSEEWDKRQQKSTPMPLELDIAKRLRLKR